MSVELITNEEQQDFARLDDVVRRGLATFVEIGKALREIRERNLYRVGFATFEAYLSHEHGLSPRRGRQIIDAAAVRIELGEGKNFSHLPSTESHCAELASYPDADRQEVWQQVVEESEKTGKPITARMIKEVGKPYREPVEPEPEDDRFTTLVEATHAMSDAFERIAERWPKDSYSVLADQLDGLAIKVRRRIEGGHYGDG